MRVVGTIRFVSSVHGNDVRVSSLCGVAGKHEELEIMKQALIFISLFSNIALFVQAALGGMALLSLVWKRSRESPQRPLKIW